MECTPARPQLASSRSANQVDESVVPVDVRSSPVGQIGEGAIDCGESPVLGDREEHGLADGRPGVSVDADGRDVRVDLDIQRERAWN